jgi:hypothetical protein
MSADIYKVIILSDKYRLPFPAASFITLARKRGRVAMASNNFCQMK